MRPALLITDMQRGFVEQLPSTRRHLDLLFEAIGKLIEHFDAHERPVIHAVTVHRPDGSTWDKTMRRRGRGRFIDGTPEAKMAEGIAVGAGHKKLTKTRRSAFVGTGLESYLKNAGIDTIVLAGSLVHEGVCRTAIDADERDFSVFLVADGVGDDGSGRAEVALEVLGRDYSVEVRPHDEIMCMLDRPLDPRETVRALNRSIEKLQQLQRPSSWNTGKDE